MGWFSDLFEKHKFVRRVGILVLFVLLAAAHFVIYAVIWKEPTLSTQAVAAFTQTLALTGVLTAWYMQLRKHEDQQLRKEEQAETERQEERDD